MPVVLQRQALVTDRNLDMPVVLQMADRNLDIPVVLQRQVSRSRQVSQSCFFSIEDVSFGPFNFDGAPACCPVHVIEHGTERQRHYIVEVLERVVFEFSKHRLASHFLQFGPHVQRQGGQAAPQQPSLPARRISKLLRTPSMAASSSVRYSHGVSCISQRPPEQDGFFVSGRFETRGGHRHDDPWSRCVAHCAHPPSFG